ncbi:hypothetical protein [Thalassospira sp. CH_XMU1420-2]|uniref:hypothetical protein n=1 Tax=Thalassospira sp. CH_XMU1420-2 TaxID=3107769 RepID=UPI00300AA6F6
MTLDTQQANDIIQSLLLRLAEGMAVYGYTSVDVIKYSPLASGSLGRFGTPRAMTASILEQTGPVDLVFSRGYLPDDQTVTIDPSASPDQLFVTFSPFAALELTINSLTETHGPNEDLSLAYLRVLCLVHEGKITLHNNGYGFAPRVSDGLDHPITECTVASCLRYGWVRWENGPFNGSKAVLTQEGRQYLMDNAKNAATS